MLEAHLGRAGMSFAGYVTLASIGEQGSAIQRQLADQLNIEGPTLSRQLERLERDGLLTRGRDSWDKRATVVELTTAGREQLARFR